MDTPSASYTFSGSTTNTTLLPVSAFSAYSLLRNCNYLLAPPPAPVSDISNKTLQLPRITTTDCSSIHPQISEDQSSSLENDKTFRNLSTKSFLTPPPPPLFGYSHPLHILQNDHLNTRHSTVISPCSSMYMTNVRRPRGEKKPIPDDQKDEKYFERRRRNNQAAKKSRDARKMREDQIALRATILEHENAILRAQILTLREETSSLRQMLLQKKTLELSTPTTDSSTQICRS